MTPSLALMLRDATDAVLRGALDDSSFVVTFGSPPNEGQCRVRLYRTADAVVVICTELDGNRGASLTEAAPAPWLAAVEVLNLPPGISVHWVEHLPASAPEVLHFFDLVEQAPCGGVAWKPLHRQQAA